MMTREQRLKDREVKRIVREQELANLEAQSQDEEGGDGRISERQRKAKREKAEQELEQYKQDEEEWYFDCAICGVHGKDLVSWQICVVWRISAKRRPRMMALIA